MISEQYVWLGFRLYAQGWTQWPLRPRRHEERSSRGFHNDPLTCFCDPSEDVGRRGFCWQPCVITTKRTPQKAKGKDGKEALFQKTTLSCQIKPSPKVLPPQTTHWHDPINRFNETSSLEFPRHCSNVRAAPAILPNYLSLFWENKKENRKRRLNWKIRGFQDISPPLPLITSRSWGKLCAFLSPVIHLQSEKGQA